MDAVRMEVLFLGLQVRDWCGGAKVVRLSRLLTSFIDDELPIRDVDPPIKLPADLAKMSGPFKAELLVQPDRGIIGKGNAGNDRVKVACPDHL